MKFLVRYLNDLFHNIKLIELDDNAGIPFLEFTERILDNSDRRYTVNLRTHIDIYMLHQIILLFILMNWLTDCTRAERISDKASFAYDKNI